MKIDESLIELVAGEIAQERDTVAAKGDKFTLRVIAKAALEAAVRWMVPDGYVRDGDGVDSVEPLDDLCNEMASDLGAYAVRPVYMGDVQWAYLDVEEVDEDGDAVGSWTTASTKEEARQAHRDSRGSAQGEDWDGGEAA